MANSKWTIGDIPDQHGKRVVITGANRGLGFGAAYALAGKGAQVVLAVRSLEKGEQAAAQIRRAYPQARVEAMHLDLADLSSVHRFGESFLQRHDGLEVLLNNAAVMVIPFRRTVDGFEMQFGTNHLGHFALTGLLLPALLASSEARVVTVSSLYHRMGSIDFGNLNSEKHYGSWEAYGRSKLANVLFAYELQRRLATSGTRVKSICCHPGYSAANSQSVGPREPDSRPMDGLYRLAKRLFAQPAAMGALPTLYAASSPDVDGGDFIGPASLGGARGYPAKSRSSARSYDVATAQELWRVSEELTGIDYRELADNEKPKIRRY